MDVVSIAAESLFNSRRVPGDPMWEDLGLIGRAYYKMIARGRIDRGQTCKSVSPDGTELCVLVEGHRHPLRHKHHTEWD